MLKYEKISLFDVPGKVILTHAANCKGVMGSGIAKGFKLRFPEAVSQYECDFNKPHAIKNQLVAGEAKIYKTSNPNILMGCLFTSCGYGKNVDCPADILMYTKLALPRFLKNCEKYKDFKIYSNKFNSGLFNVPWEKTEKLIIDALKYYPHVDWVVCDPNL